MSVSNSIVRIISEKYSTNEYNLKTPRAKNLCIHFLIALNEPENKVVEVVAKQRNAIKILSPDPESYQLTTLHLAVIYGKIQVLAAVLKKLTKDELNPKDRFDWTPLHHAQLGLPEAARLLIEAGAVAPAHKLQQIRFSAGLEGFFPSLKNIKFLDEDFISITDPNSPQLRNFTALKKYSDCATLSPEFWHHIWQPKNPAQTEQVALENNFINKQFNHWKQTGGPKLIVRPCQPLIGKVPIPLGLYAGEKIVKGQAVSPYGGQQQLMHAKAKTFAQTFLPPWSTDFYSYETVNAAEKGNASRWANTGFPNCYMQNFSNENGVIDSILIALEDISEGAPVLWNYGCFLTSLSWGTFVLMRKDEMRSYFRFGLEGLVDELLSLDKARVKGKYEDVINYHNALFKIHFVLCNPAALLDLIFFKITTADEWLDLINHPFFDEFVSMSSLYLGKTILMLNFIKEFESRIKSSPELFKQTSDWVLGSIGELSVMHILKGLQMVEPELNWSEFKKKLNTKMNNYNWLNDQEAPLGIPKHREWMWKTLSKDKSQDDMLVFLNQKKQLLIIDGLKEDEEAILIVNWLINRAKEMPKN